MIRRSCVAGVVLVHFAMTAYAPAIRADAGLLHTYGNLTGHEVLTVIAVDSSKLQPLIPADYNLVPASAVGFGTPDQGIVAIAHFRAFQPTIDHRRPLAQAQVAIDLLVLIAEPQQAPQAGVSIPGANHVYALEIYTDDARYAASLHRADLPVQFVNRIQYDRVMDDATGVGSLQVSVPARDAPFHTFSESMGYVPMPGAFNAVFWFDGKQGRSVLHFVDEPFRQGTAITSIYTKPGSRWNRLFEGGGLGAGPPHPVTGYPCVIAPAVNLRYDAGTVGRLLLFQ